MCNHAEQCRCPAVDLYVRKSKIVRDEDPRDLLSITDQEARGRAWADKNGYRVRRVWPENLSAWSDVKRPQFDGALASLLSGEVPCLWCAFLDRFSRKGIDDIGPILGRARVVFDYEGLDSSVERDRRWIIDRAEQAREYSSRLSYNVRSTKATQRSQGKWLSAAPYGLELDGPKTRKLRPSADWPVVEYLVTAVASGASQRSWCHEANARGIPSPNGGQWTSSTTSNILANPVYEGWQVIRGGRRPDVFRAADGSRVSVFADGAAPLDAALLAKARAAAAGLAKPLRSTRRSHLLSGGGLTHCAGCEGALPCSGRSYVCSTHNMGKVCPAPASATREALENYVRDRWVARLSGADPEDPLLAEVASRYAALRSPASAKEARESAVAVKVAEAGVQRLVRQQAEGLFDPPFDTHLPALQREARAALETAKSRVAALTPQRVNISWLQDAETALAGWQAATADARRDFVDLAIRRIYVKKAERRGPFDGAARVVIEWHEM